MEDIVQIFVGNFIHCTERLKLQVVENGFIIVKGRKIVATGKKADLNSTKARLDLKDGADEKILTGSQILIPGFVDTHIHAPQYPNCGLGYDKPLLEWLETYTYKVEKIYRDQELSRRVFDAVVKNTLANGTTTACYFASLFNNSSMLLVDAAIRHSQRALIGKINMTTLAPDDYLETPEESLENTKIFIEYVKSQKSDLVKPVITPRFALSVDMDLMKKLGDLAAYEDLHIQTHISENSSEVDMVVSKYNMLYANVYDEAQLLTSKTILAHGVYLTDEEIQLIARRGASISHCPESNTCLKSGLCDVYNLLNRGVIVGLGTDVSGGPLPSILRAMKAALDTSIHISFQYKNYMPLTYKDVFYLATLGGAEALSLHDKIGNFQEGKDFDALIIDMDAKDSPVDFLLECSVLEIFQKFIYTGDDRNIINVFVAGKQVK
ncbi:unnamed protein product [Phaedon cochleariae]|uniref:Guanine deaminase n=1 Tax=Phaedon cochleariae TaxID=80249 RepID=A0A9P0D9Y4_PHACE|nr:unnamed protein product [Phaedon cochleariae]